MSYISLFFVSVSFVLYMHVVLKSQNVGLLLTEILMTLAPITPCRHARAGELSGDMARVYDLVTRHFIASVSVDAVWKSTTVCFSIDELEDKGTFTLRGKQVRCSLSSAFAVITI